MTRNSVDRDSASLESGGGGGVGMKWKRFARSQTSDRSTFIPFGAVKNSDSECHPVMCASCIPILCR